MSEETIPELADVDRFSLQVQGAWDQMIEAVNALSEALVEALQPLVEAIVDFVDRMIERVQRWQLWGVLDRWHIPGAEWLSEHWPRRFLPGLLLDLWVT